MDRPSAIKELIKEGKLPTPSNINQLTQTKPLQKTHSTIEPSVKVISSYQYNPKKIKVEDFVQHTRSRYDHLKSLLINRAEIQDATSISRLSGINERTTIIAMVSDIQKLPSGALRVILEDLSGKTPAIISAKDPELAKKARYLALDEVCAFKGAKSKNMFFVNDIVWPDIPQKTRQNSPDEVYAAFTGDLHAGSNMFLPKQLDRFISWLSGELGNEKQKQMALKTKYVFVVGDIVDGVGIYPEQEKELDVTDIYKQYELAASFLAKIPKDKKIIICPGNHDAMRICEPQPALYKDLAAPLYELPNAIHVSNPAVVNIHSQDNFPGFDVLMYHGYSFDFFVDKVDALRAAGGYDRPDKLIEFLLKRRHLAPTYGSTLALPMNEDPLLIRLVPDIVATGHIHKAKISQYRNILTIAASCWQKRTSFQERVGHHPDPAKVPLVNLQTGKATMLKFD